MNNQLIARRNFLSSSASALAGSALLPSLAKSAHRKGKLLYHTTEISNAEPVLSELVRNWMTPTDAFYIRSHAPIPKINHDSFRLKVEGLVEKPLSLTLKQLGNLPQSKIVATLTCAGNRRSEHIAIKPVKGVPWKEGAIGNAEWSGAKLSDVLRMAGVKAEAKHVWFEGLDQIQRSNGVIPFGASIPLIKAMFDSEKMPGTVLATGMNGEPLNGDHGSPLRTVVPGYIGARSVKWLGKIVVSDRPSPNHYVATAYKIVEDGTPLEWSEQGPIYRMPLNSAICSQVKRSKSLIVAGYALPQGRPGTSIRKVEVSPDNGRNWIEARITSPSREFCWVLWTAAIPSRNAGDELMVRATDSRGSIQPEQVNWNSKGYLFNSWHKVKTI